MHGGHARSELQDEVHHALGAEAEALARGAGQEHAERARVAHEGHGVADGAPRVIDDRAQSELNFLQAQTRSRVAHVARCPIPISLGAWSGRSASEKSGGATDGGIEGVVETAR
jgi:hypothetical protein